MVEEKAKDWTGKPDSCLYGPHQWTVEKRPKEWIKKGLTLKLVAILVPLTVLFVAILVLGFYTVFMLKGDAKNINYAGNLRYRSYKLALQVNEYPVLQGGVRDRAHRTILSNMGDFETILYGLRDSHKDLGLKGFKPPPGVKEGVFSYTDPWWQFDRRIKDYNERVRPLILHILNFTNREEAMEALKLYNKNVNDFVTDVDRSVHLLQLLSEEKLSGFKTTEFILLGLFLGIIGASFSLSVFFIRRPLLGILKGAEAFSRGDLNYRVPVRGRDEMGALASGFNTMAETIENNIERLKDSLLDTVRCLSEAIDAKSPWTRGHSDRVAGLSCDIARELGLGEEDIERIRMASLLHDVGKIGTNEGLLDKPGKLTPEEWDMVKKHCAEGVKIIRPVERFNELIPMILYHHERYDGKGYPEDKKGEEIPLGARIICIADAVDAMTSERPYRKAKPMEEVVEELKKNAGVQFCPKVAEATLKVLERQRAKL